METVYSSRLEIPETSYRQALNPAGLKGGDLEKSNAYAIAESSDNKELIPDQITLVIPVYNEERFLRECLESCVEQVDRVVLIDNASEDGTEAICREFAGKYPHILYIRNEENIGSVGSFLKAIQHVKTEFFATMGGHDVVGPNYYRKLKETLKANPDCAQAAGRLANIDVEGKDITKKLMPILIRLGMKYLSSDNAFVRAFGSLNCDAQASFYSLFRWAKTEEPFSRLLPCSGCDEIVLFEIQIREKTCYCDDVIFFRRMVRIGCESADRTKYMQRMVGNDFDAAKLHQSIEAFFSEMYRIVDSLGKPKTWLGRWYYLRTKFRLFRKHSEAKCFLVFNHYPLTTRLWGFLRGCKQGLRRFLSRFSRN